MLELARGGSIDLAVTRYIRDDIPQRPLRDRLDELPSLNIDMTGGLFTIGYSALGGPDFLGSDAFETCRLAISPTWRPSCRGSAPDERDWAHLHAHYAKRRDWFLTWDRPLLELGALLEEGFALGVTAPDLYLSSRHDAV